jgi:predicted nucleic acid-binding protein
LNIYVESSAALSWILEEPRAEEVRQILAESQLVLSSFLTLVECDRSLICAHTLGRVLEEEVVDRRRLLAAAAEQWHLLRLDDEILERSRLPFPREPIRTLDALHLASALACRSVVRKLALLTLDDRLRANGRALGFDLLPA